MPTVDLDFTLTFKLDQNPKTIELVDTTDYTGFDFTGLSSFWEITSPDGSILSSGSVFESGVPTTEVSLPLLSDGTVEPGIYTANINNQGDASNTETKTFNFCYESPEVTISLSSDCVKPELISQDTTAYTVEGVTPTIVRDHRIYYPSSLDLTPEVSTGTSFVLTNFFTGTQTAKVTSTLVYDYTNGIFINDEVTGSQEHDVVCDNTLCDLYCCLIALYRRYDTAKRENAVLAQKEKDKFLQAMSIRSLIKDSLECDKGSNVNDLVADVLKIAGCEPGCGCADGEPVAVVGLSSGAGAGLSITIVDTTGNGIEVTSNTVGDTTTYTLNLQTALVSKLNGLQNSEVLATASELVEVTETIDGVTGDKTYEITDKPGVLQNKYYMLASVKFSRTASPTFTVVEEKVVGTAFQASGAFALSSFDINPPDYDTRQNRIDLSNFLTAGGVQFYPTLTAVSIGLDSSINPVSIREDQTNRFDCRINGRSTASNGALSFSLYESSPTTGVVSRPTGNGLNAGVLGKTKSIDEMYVLVSIEITL